MGIIQATVDTQSTTLPTQQHENALPSNEPRQDGTINSLTVSTQLSNPDDLAVAEHLRTTRQQSLPNGYNECVRNVLDGRGLAISNTGRDLASGVLATDPIKAKYHNTQTGVVSHCQIAINPARIEGDALGSNFVSSPYVEKNILVNKTTGITIGANSGICEPVAQQLSIDYVDLVSSDPLTGGSSDPCHPSLYDEIYYDCVTHQARPACVTQAPTTAPTTEIPTAPLGCIDSVLAEHHLKRLFPDDTNQPPKNTLRLYTHPSLSEGREGTDYIFFVGETLIHHNIANQPCQYLINPNRDASLSLADVQRSTFDPLITNRNILATMDDVPVGIEPIPDAQCLPKNTTINTIPFYELARNDANPQDGCNLSIEQEIYYDCITHQARPACVTQAPTTQAPTQQPSGAPKNGTINASTTSVSPSQAMPSPTPSSPSSSVTFTPSATPSPVHEIKTTSTSQRIDFSGLTSSKVPSLSELMSTKADYLESTQIYSSIQSMSTQARSFASSIAPPSYSPTLKETPALASSDTGLITGAPDTSTLAPSIAVPLSFLGAGATGVVIYGLYRLYKYFDNKRHASVEIPQYHLDRDNSIINSPAPYRRGIPDGREIPASSVIPPDIVPMQELPKEVAVSMDATTI